MNKSKTIKWVAAALARLVVGGVAGKLGWDALQSGDMEEKVTTLLVTLVLIIISVVSSIKGRDKILKTPPPQ